MRKAIAISMLVALSGFLLAACGGAGTEKLTATTWYLVAGGEQNPSWQWTVPPDLQDRYTIRFENDGAFTSRADCNQLSGTWQARGSDRVTLTPGPMTMASCGELSFDILYAGLLGQVRGWNVASTGMSLTLADGGRLDYTSVTPTSPSPSDAPAEPTDAETPSPTFTPTESSSATPAPTATATATVTATVTATRSPSASASRSTPPPTPRPTSPTASTTRPTPPPSPEPTATSTPTSTATPTPGPELTSRSWQLAAFSLQLPPFAGDVPQDQQARYTIQFRADGSFSAQADCNTVNGTYSPPDPSGTSGSLSLSPGPATIKACEEGSYGDLYLTALANTDGFAINGQALVLTLVDSGTLEYR